MAVCPVSGAAIARCARQPISRYGRPMPPGERERLLEVAPRIVQARRPQLGDPEVHQRGGAQVVAAGTSPARLRRQRRLQRRHRLERSRAGPCAGAPSASLTTAAPARSGARRSAGSRRPAARRRRGRQRRPRARRRGSRTAAKTSASSGSVVGSAGREPRPAARGRSPGAPSRIRAMRLSASRRAACGQSRAACAWRIASTTSPCSSYHRPPPGAARRSIAGCGAPQLELQQVGEQVVIAKPGPRRTSSGGDERVGLLELLQDPLRPRAAGQPVGQRAAHPLQHRRPQQQLAAPRLGWRSSTSAIR